MKHVFWLIPNRLAGRPGPSYAPWSLAELRHAGFGAVVNLTESEPEHAVLEGHRIAVGWFPIPDDYPANEQTEVICESVLPEAHAFLRLHLDTGKKVLVHCAWGRDRTGLLLAYHTAMSRGESPASAIAAVKRVQPHALNSPGWEAMAERVIAVHQPLQT